LYLVSFIALLFIATAPVSASPNVGLLRVSNFYCPREVVPGSSFPVNLDIEYAIQTMPDQATIRAAVFDGSDNSANPLWQSGPTSVSNGGDQVWNFTLNAPPTEGFLNLTAYAYFLDNGTWSYFNNPMNGPGVSQRTVKVGRTASLEIDIGAPGVAVTVDGTTDQTSSSGDTVFPVAVSATPSVSVPSTLTLQNSTRIIFSQWSDGVTQAQRQVLIDGDVNLTAQYRVQYLLTVNNGSSVEAWYDKGMNATLTAPTSTSTPWPLDAFGVTEAFQGWSGDVQSTSPQVNVTMNSPKTVTAEMSIDYRPVVVPAILAAGFATAILSFVLVRSRTTSIESNTVETPVEEKTPSPGPSCPGCGQVTEPDWTHCIKCGTKLKDVHSSTGQTAK
jgi:hypothetical protein